MSGDKIASQDALENALRAARELWYEESSLYDAIEGLEPVSVLRQANAVSMVYEVSRSMLLPRLPAGADENWHPVKIS